MIWRRSDVDENKQYRLHLCASKDGKRFYKLVEIGSDADSVSSDDVFLITALVPNDLLKRGDLISISELVPLESGQPFFVEAHGVWYSASEVQQLDSGLKYHEVQWLTKKPPILAPK